MQTNIGRVKRVALIVDKITHIAMGDDDTPPTGADTALGNELTRTTVSSKFVGGTGFFTVRTRIPSGSTYEFKETGTFDGILGDMLDRIVYAPVTKPSGVELVVDIRFEVS